MDLRTSGSNGPNKRKQKSISKDKSILSNK